MKKILLTIILFATAICFSQSLNTADSAFTIAQIDSIALKNGSSGIAEGNIKSEKIVVREDKKRVVKGGGKSSITIYEHKTPTTFRLIKGEYSRTIKYKDKSTENVSAQLYYDEKQLFFIRLTELIVEGTEEIRKTHNIDVSKMNSLQNSDFHFTTNIQKWIAQLDSEVLRLSKDTKNARNGN